MYPVPFARPEDVVPTAQLAERVGFDSVWGNDHMTTQRYVQREWPTPPNFYEPLIAFTYVAARTERIKLATGIIVLPMRTMPVLAKQVATLDQLSGGRVILGVGTGAYREEYEALYDYEVVARTYTGSEVFVAALERELDIARRYANGEKRRLWGMRIASAESEAEELLIRVQERLPGSSLAEEAALLLGDFYFSRRQMDLAARCAWVGFAHGPALSSGVDQL